jgi:tetratricopeptide (TPR) repeat protein
VAYFEGEFVAAQDVFDEALAIRRELGDKSGIANALNNLGIVVYSQGNFIKAQVLYEESLAICRELGEKWIMAHVLLNLGHVAYGQGDYAGARALYEEDLMICHELGDKDGLAFALSGLADVLCTEVQDTRSARVQGAVSSFMKELGTSLEPIEQTGFNKTATTLKEILGEENYKKEFEAGEVLSLEQAINLALKRD